MNVIMPQLGETVEEGTVAVWHKKEGDKVAIDELLVEIETDKVATEVPSLAAGTLLKILVGEGETVKVGTTLAIIDSGDAPGAVAPKASGAPAAATQPSKPATPTPLRVRRRADRRATIARAPSMPSGARRAPSRLPKNRLLRLAGHVRWPTWNGSCARRSVCAAR